MASTRRNPASIVNPTDEGRALFSNADEELALIDSVI
jgi:hypothetical protein